MSRIARFSLIALLAGTAGCTFDFSNPAEELAAGEIRGTLVHRDGGVDNPATGATVTLYGTSRWVEADADGSFRFLGLPAGTHRLLARHELPSGEERVRDLRNLRIENVGSVRGGVDLGTVVLGATGVITGRIERQLGTEGGLTEGRADVEEVWVTLAVLETDHRMSVPTTPSGEFTFRGLPPGTYRVAAAAAGYVPLVEEGIDLSDGASADLGTLQLQASAESSPTGFVVGQAQRLVASGDDYTAGERHDGVEVMALPGQQAVETRAAGDFDLELPQGIYTLRLTADGYQPTIVPNVLAKPGDDSFDIGTVVLYPSDGSCDLSVSGGDGDGDGVPDAEEPEPCRCDPFGTVLIGEGDGAYCVLDRDDRDGDGVATPDDNCPEIANPQQEDRDDDGIGDACQPNAPPVVVISAPTDAAEVAVGDTLVLDASGSNDPDGDPLAFAWSVTEEPDGSSATITDAALAVASFVPDLPGSYSFAVEVADDTDGLASAQVSVVAIALFEITEVTPAVGVVGDLITIAGSQLLGSAQDPKVTFDGARGEPLVATITSQANDAIEVRVPLGAVDGELVVDRDGERQSALFTVRADESQQRSKLTLPDAFADVQVDWYHDLLYLAQGTDSIQIFDLHDPDNPQQLGSFGFTSQQPIHQVEVFGSYLVAIAGGGMQIGAPTSVCVFDIRDDPTQPAQIECVESLAGCPFKVAVVDDLAVIATPTPMAGDTQDCRLPWTADVLSLADSQLVGSLSFDSQPELLSVQVAGGELFLLFGEPYSSVWEIQALDLSIAAAPLPMERMPFYLGMGDSMVPGGLAGSADSLLMFTGSSVYRSPVGVDGQWGNPASFVEWPAEPLISLPADLAVNFVEASGPYLYVGVSMSGGSGGYVMVYHLGDGSGAPQFLSAVPVMSMYDSTVRRVAGNLLFHEAYGQTTTELAVHQVGERPVPFLTRMSPSWNQLVGQPVWLYGYHLTGDGSEAPVVTMGNLQAPISTSTPEFIEAEVPTGFEFGDVAVTVGDDQSNAFYLSEGAPSAELVAVSPTAPFGGAVVLTPQSDGTVSGDTITLDFEFDLLWAQATSAGLSVDSGTTVTGAVAGGRITFADVVVTEAASSAWARIDHDGAQYPTTTSVDLLVDLTAPDLSITVLNGNQNTNIDLSAGEDADIEADGVQVDLEIRDNAWSSLDEGRMVIIEWDDGSQLVPVAWATFQQMDGLAAFAQVTIPDGDSSATFVARYRDGAGFDGEVTLDMTVGPELQ